MKIFKNRGDFYISKASYKSSREERILLSLLAVVIVITVVFFVILSNKYSSVKEFFGDGEVSTTQIVEQKEKMPAISGKRNFLFLETDEEESTIHYIFLLQADRDSKAYKVCTFSPKMSIDGTSIYDIYTQGGGASLQTKLTAYLGVNIDYYATFKASDLVEVFNKFGKFSYNSDKEIRFNSKEKEDSYIVKIRQGDSTLDGKDFSSVMRYFSNEKVDYSKSNEIVLYAMTQIINSENYEDAEALFKLFINSSVTNITVRNFQDNQDAIYVFSKKNTSLNVYSVNSEYDGNNSLSHKSVKEIKGYFAK